MTQYEKQMKYIFTALHSTNDQIHFRRPKHKVV